MDQSNFQKTFWFFFVIATVTVIMLAAIRWSFDHPFGIHWDEAQYFNDVQIDVQRLHAGMIIKLGGRILKQSYGRPPAFRIVALPFLALFGFHAVGARLVSLACFAFSSWFIFLATRRIASQVAGALAVLVFSLSPEVVSAAIFFGTDTSLYLATSAVLYYLFLIWSDRSDHAGTWIGLGLAIGLGLLSKASFILIVFPVLAFSLAVVSRYKHSGGPRFAVQSKAIALGLLLAAPWWLLNAKSALAYGQYSRDFVRNSLGSPSLVTWMQWLSTVLQGLIGHGLSILIGLVFLACFWKVIVRKETILNPLQRVVLGACACAGVPIVLAQLSGTNHLLRHISPAVIPLAIAVGVLSDKTGWIHSWASIAVSCILFVAQLLMIVVPVLSPNSHPVDVGFVNGGLPWRIMVRFDQWDWKPVQDIAHNCGIETPKISYLGNGRAFNPPQIEYPWVAQGTSTRRVNLDFADVRWLWRYEDGPLGWQKVMESADQSDIVLTAPGYVGEPRNKEDLDNQYNTEFAMRLSHDPRFRGPIRLEMGRFAPVEVVLFVKKDIICQSL